jgi:hypothetical protein
VSRPSRTFSAFARLRTETLSGDCIRADNIFYLLPSSSPSSPRFALPLLLRLPLPSAPPFSAPPSCKVTVLRCWEFSESRLGS